jgi:hydrogenase maturation protease
MAPVLIIGYGNPLRCDDGVAWHVADALSCQNLPGVEIVVRHQLTPELASPVSQADTVLFVDAAEGAQAGELKWAAVTPQLTLGVFFHEFSPRVILGLAQDLYGACPQAFVISLTGECFDHGETLSGSVQKSLPRLCELITELAMKHCTAHRATANG